LFYTKTLEKKIYKIKETWKKKYIKSRKPRENPPPEKYNITRKKLKMKASRKDITIAKYANPFLHLRE
jgi:hypothetical protein